MGSGPWSLLKHYGLAAVLTALAILASLLLAPHWNPRHLLLPFYPAVMLSAWFGGFGPGLLTTLLSALAMDYFWLLLAAADLRLRHAGARRPHRVRALPRCGAPRQRPQREAAPGAATRRGCGGRAPTRGGRASKGGGGGREAREAGRGARVLGGAVSPPLQAAPRGRVPRPARRAHRGVQRRLRPPPGRGLVRRGPCAQRERALPRSGGVAGAGGRSRPGRGDLEPGAHVAAERPHAPERDRKSV